MLRQLTSFGDEVREDEPLPFVESRETPLDADADVNPRITRRKSLAFIGSAEARHACESRKVGCRGSFDNEFPMSWRHHES